MIIYPAIDLKDGLCVRLMQGDPDRATIYGRDPVAVARRWEGEGAEWLHVVDLDGAFAKAPKNREIIASIARSISIPVQVGGGIRNLETIEEYLALGVERVILGTAALRDPKILHEACRRHPHRIALGIDARDGQVAVEGWKETTGTDAIAFVQRFAHLDLAAVIFTDIHRDGMQSGVNVESTRRMLEATRLPVIASGGVATLADVEALLPLVPLGLLGVITGRAIYNGTLILGEAIARLKSHMKDGGPMETGSTPK
ncbi:1-(5-phosphoribosyl)-5-[(5-phosphoribosylamino)methylideneamino]imidazole-4-carboxamide isomerase [Desulforhabdus sp. TSK]|uniref:1-(5-phosphoribosyl)-5-[(5- phosphoribosylamino)methylideneamino]imidazole-4- carboxamide isomerase n=1 Tax=Desulforhabdus sp. TSK TaxID=2925014 RepID=UPI001FC88FB3|nr:1-(5-phosphoribosyl)-5-[(5-phosphoribosylamino)methylideneamino]imidazole-4-carboxamide isomerase [Desulforhabdus sp. TSK]GKT08040.1 1-(5-phosphoribosyl)-5-[(5-phosphoribosylamino) methylideneamino] imidazole-4-carboxamide isomerase [Desulforhabdus sp. TSK]